MQSLHGRISAELWKNRGKKLNDTVYQITQENIAEYIAEMKENKLSDTSCKDYQRTLRMFYDFLPPEKTIDQEKIELWRQQMQEQGYAVRTIKARVSIANGYLRYLNHLNRGWPVAQPMDDETESQPELSRQEYLRLLQAARHLEQKDLYLLIKTLGCMGIQVRDLECVTAEAVHKGYISISAGKKRRILRFPNTLREDLGEYIQEKGFVRGYVFRTRTGLPLNRSNIWKRIQAICHDARVPEEKATPACLIRLHKSTYNGIAAKAQLWIEQTYEQMLEEEQFVAGWDIE